MWLEIGKTAKMAIGQEVDNDTLLIYLVNLVTGFVVVEPSSRA